MNPKLLVVSLFMAYLLVYLAAAYLLANLSRRGRMPSGKDSKLLRSPGLFLQEQLEATDSQLFDAIAAGLLLPLFMLIFPALGLPYIPESFLLAALVVIVAGFIATFVLRLRSLLGLIQRRRSLWLGLRGEQLVADRLQTLLSKGYHVFHDLPAQGSQQSFNLDHVVVGPSGLYCIETKTRKKPNAVATGNDHCVVFEGDALRWPSFVDRDSCEQAVSNARWLAGYLKRQLGMDLMVTPILALPGWFVERKAGGLLRAVNETQLCSAIEGKPVLDARTIDLVQRQLDSACRTAVFEVS